MAASTLLALAGCGGGDAEAPDQRERQPAAPATATPPGEVAAVTLAPKFTLGERATFEHEETSTKTQSTAQHSYLREATEIRVFDLETIEVAEDGGATLRLTMRRVGSVLADNGVVTYRYDSAEPNDVAAEARSAPTRARDALAGLVAEIQVAPDGTTRGLRANLTPSQVRSLPPGLRPLLSENWARGVMEWLYRPYGDVTKAPIGGRVRREVEATGALAREGDSLVQILTGEMGEGGHPRLVSETTLRSEGEASPEVYHQQMVIDWSPARGRVEAARRTERARLELELAGLDGVETLERRFSIVEVNATPENDDEPAPAGVLPDRSSDPSR
jgi:hypothetical protein